MQHIPDQPLSEDIRVGREVRRGLSERGLSDATRSTPHRTAVKTACALALALATLCGTAVLVRMVLDQREAIAARLVQISSHMAHGEPGRAGSAVPAAAPAAASNQSRTDSLRKHVHREENDSNAIAHKRVHLMNDSFTLPRIETTSTTQSSHHEVCSGGQVAICECMLNCTVFGHRRADCRSRGSEIEADRLVHDMVAQQMTNYSSVCGGMVCLVHCARQLGCYHSEVRQDCQNLQRLQMAGGEMDCGLECDI